MRKNKGPGKGLTLAYTDFAKSVSNWDFTEHSGKELAAMLQEAVLTETRLDEAYGIIKEVIRRETGLSLFDSQILTACSMQQGHIAELPTGEGKTLAAVVTAAVFALRKQPVHILVFNDYLARRDYEMSRAIYETCELTCGYIGEKSGFHDRKAAYACDVVYVPVKEAAFDYLRDFLCMEKEHLLFPDFSVALVDEADSILIDEARLPLVLAGCAETRLSGAAQAAAVVSRLKAEDVGINPAANQVWLTETGIDLVEADLHLTNLYAPENMGMLAQVSAALEARFLLKRDRDYIVRNGIIQVIDAATGRVAENRRFPDLLHQAVEIWECGTGTPPAVIYNSMSMQAFLQQYRVLCGMTGTAASSARELRNLYDLKVDVIRPHVPCIRTDHPDMVFLRRADWQEAIVSCIKELHRRGQPVLIGTQSVEESEQLSEQLAAEGVEHSVLNAKNDTHEAALIARAGEPFRVTVSTNMAGRGVDIKLGGQEEHAELVRGLGGLFVLSTGMNRSVRLDNQLRGRAGRQGNPGESRFFICMEHLDEEQFKDAVAYNYKRYPKLLRRAQRAQEGKDAEARYMLERYAEVSETMRNQMTQYRTAVLLDKKKPDIMQKENPEIYRSLIGKAGEQGVEIAEKQLILYFINQNWASYLAAMEDKRNGIHLLLIGGKNPLDEYRKFASAAFAEMQRDIVLDVADAMQRFPITETGIDMGKSGLTGATTTFTYMVDESMSQFSRIPYFINKMSNTIKGTVYTVQKFLTRKQLRGK